MTFKKVLIAVDGEPVTAHAAETGVDLAQALGAEVAFIHVVDSSLAYPGDTGTPPHEMIASAKLHAKKLITAIRQRLRPQSSALEFIEVGRPSEEIVKGANEWSADLIVIGSHGRGGNGAGAPRQRGRSCDASRAMSRCGRAGQRLSLYQTRAARPVLVDAVADLS